MFVCLAHQPAFLQGGNKAVLDLGQRAARDIGHGDKEAVAAYLFHHLGHPSGHRIGCAGKLGESVVEGRHGVADGPAGGVLPVVREDLLVPVRGDVVGQRLVEVELVEVDVDDFGEVGQALLRCSRARTRAGVLDVARPLPCPHPEWG